jgi:molecular chaperone HtpG
LKEKKKKKDITVDHQCELASQNKIFWTHPQSEVTDDEYGEFYKALSNDWEIHLLVNHFRTVGYAGFTILLFVTKCTQYDLFEPKKKLNNIKLYVRRVFAMDNFKELILKYFNFLIGIVN